ncbi:MAG: hypothetical protein AABX89_06435 [Candidatus Thermoplasmatota archaeon]
MATLRVAVICKDNATAKLFKEDKENFKKLLSEAGTKLTFEFPLSDEAGAKALMGRAEAAGFKATKETYEDPLDSSGASADFW